MVQGSKGDLHFDLMVEILEHCIVKILVVVNCDVSRDVKCQMIFCQKNFLLVAKLMFVTGFASTHFVKYSTTTIAKV
jgi:hypothetical protein